MKKLLYGLLTALIAIATFFTGFLIRQPKINKLKKQLQLLQNDNSKLIGMVEEKKKEYQELHIQHMALKALQFRKKAASKERLQENLVMQYAVRSYIELLIKSGRYEQGLSKDEVVFFNSFEKVINGKLLSATDKVKIREYMMKFHGEDIKKLKECEYSSILGELQSKPQTSAEV
jgi:hypothetical protein